jgi:hypothetical protein
VAEEVDLEQASPLVDREGGAPTISAQGFDPYFRALTREFPAHRNREFFEAEQGINSREQGI